MNANVRREVTGDSALDYNRAYAKDIALVTLLMNWLFSGFAFIRVHSRTGIS